MKHKHTFWIIGPIAITALAFGCKPADRSADDAEPTVSQQVKKVQADTKQAADDLSAFTHAQKEAFIENLELRLKEINREIDELSVRIKNSGAAVQAEAEPRIAQLRTQSDKLKKELDNVKDAGESTWESTKNAASKAYNDLKTGFHNTREWLSEKIAP
jgi:DNA anti-recombination protein RmuC